MESRNFIGEHTESAEIGLSETVASNWRSSKLLNVRIIIRCTHYTQHLRTFQEDSGSLIFLTLTLRTGADITLLLRFVLCVLLSVAIRLHRQNRPRRGRQETAECGEEGSSDAAGLGKRGTGSIFHRCQRIHSICLRSKCLNYTAARLSIIPLIQWFSINFACLLGHAR